MNRLNRRFAGDPISRTGSSGSGPAPWSRRIVDYSTPEPPPANREAPPPARLDRADPLVGHRHGRPVDLAGELVGGGARSGAGRLFLLPFFPPETPSASRPGAG